MSEGTGREVITGIDKASVQYWGCRGCYTILLGNLWVQICVVLRLGVQSPIPSIACCR